jgi:hypothetical protein
MKNGLFALVAVAVVASSALAGTSWAERSAGAALQVVGRCNSSSSRWEGGSIYSYCDLTVLRLLAGAPTETVLVRQRGGAVDGIGQRVSHKPLLESGSSYLLFLAPLPDGAWAPTAKGVNPILDLAGVGETVLGEPLDEVIAALGGAR